MFWVLFAFLGSVKAADCPGELLYNGICLPKDWPPRIGDLSKEYSDPPYLQNPPPVISIDVGRQLFVDTFLIEDCQNCSIRYHNASYNNDINPVLAADQPWEGSANLTTAEATTYSGGVWWDPRESLFKMWYSCGDGNLPRKQCYAVSKDGLRWSKPVLDVVETTNIVQEDGIDGSTVWLNVDSEDLDHRYVMGMVPAYNNYHAYSLLSSTDGVHWRVVVNATGPVDDRSTIFYNPFRHKWIFSMKSDFFDDNNPQQTGRSRAYWECDDLFDCPSWDESTRFNWTNADNLDPKMGCGSGPGHSGFTQLYNLDAVAYESVLVGFFSIFNGKYCGPDSPYNRTGEWDSVFLGFSRDGFYWSRPVIDGRHQVFLPMNDSVAPPWPWNKSNVQSVGGGFAVINQENALRFYVGARTGTDQLIGNASVGIATMRRDGFASVCVTEGSRAVLTTRTVSFSAGHRLFLNAIASDQEPIGVEILDAQTDLPIQPFALSNNLAMTTDSTIFEVFWKGPNGIPDSQLGALDGKPVKFRFVLQGSSQLFAFWVSQVECGYSLGYVAAGGPGFTSSQDDIGRCWH